MLLHNVSESDTAGLSGESDVPAAEATARAFARFLTDADADVTLEILRSDGSRLRLSVPTSLRQVLAQSFQSATERPAVAFPSSPAGVELTTHQAAKLLGVSRPYLIKQLDAGKIPFHRVGTHRRIRYSDLAEYRERDRDERNRGLDELTALSEEYGLYDARL